MATSTTPTPKQQFLASYEREQATTMRVLRAYPTDKLDLRPHPKCKTARELAWMFVLERGLGTRVMNNEFATGGPSGAPPPPPESWQDILAALEKAHKDFADLVASIPDDRMFDPVKFFTAPKTLDDIPGLEFLWFLLGDQIHHRGQFSIYLRMADAKVPSIYGPSADEKWF
jgi:uncharacterized damage-inducible protein DinB